MLSPEEIAAAARDEGVDAQELAAALRDVEGSQSDASPKDEESGKGAADRLLTGFLDYVKVKELRARLGFNDSIADDEMGCTAYSIKHGLKPDPTKGTATPSTATTDGEAE